MRAGRWAGRHVTAASGMSSLHPGLKPSCRARVRPCGLRGLGAVVSWRGGSSGFGEHHSTAPAPARASSLLTCCAGHSPSEDKSAPHARIMPQNTQRSCRNNEYLASAGCHARLPMILFQPFYAGVAFETCCRALHRHLAFCFGERQRLATTTRRAYMIVECQYFTKVCSMYFYDTPITLL
jgi:hypothetical protein